VGLHEKLSPVVICLPDSTAELEDVEPTCLRERKARPISKQELEKQYKTVLREIKDMGWSDTFQHGKKLLEKYGDLFLEKSGIDEVEAL